MVDNFGFIHLRCRSSYSLAEGAIKIDELIDLALSNNMPAIALTDNGNLFGALEFSLKAAKKGLQPILGCILDIDLDNSNNNFTSNQNISKILLIASNSMGWKNLSILATKSFLDSTTSQQRPLKIEEIFKYSEGLICLLGGIYGPIGICFLNNKVDEARNLAISFKNNFKDNLFIEIMRHGFEEEELIEKKFLNLSNDLNIPIVATNNIYFDNKDMFESHDCLMCISQGVTLSDPNRFRINNEHYFKNFQEMKVLFSDIPIALSNTIIVAKKCSLLLEEKSPVLPTYPKIKNLSEHDTLIKESEAGLNLRLKNIGANGFSSNFNKNIYMERLSYELDTISKMGFSGYFLIVSEFVNWAKENNIPVGPGRGSGAGSLVAWCLGITNLDPIKFNLLFERFLNPERISMPDFDIDFCQIKRDEVIEHVKDTYGEDRVAQIITFGSLQARGVLRDVGRVLEMPYGQVDELCRLVPNFPGATVTLKDAINDEPRLVAAKESGEEVSQLFEISLKLEGLYRNAATHAAGVVIGNKPLVNIIPLYKDAKANLPATQYNMKYTELSGLVKFDFLGLKTLSILEMASKLLQSIDNTFDIENIPLNDKSTYDLISSGETIGIFQLESQGMREVLQSLKPDRFEDIIAVVALYRPGPMDNIPSFVDRKHGREKVQVLHPLLEDILEETYGIMIYQEQVMEIAQKLAGYSLGEADLLRRAMGKKIKAEMDAQKENFVSGAKENNITNDISSKIFELISPFAGYAFNKSHAAAYAMIAYQTAWFKANHPEIYMASLMTFDSDNAEKLAIFKNELSRLDIKILGPDVNFSDVSYSIEKNTDHTLSIRTGLCSIKNIGNKALQIIVDKRLSHGSYKDLLSFSDTIGDEVISKSHYEFLASSGAFDTLCTNRKQAYESAEVLADLASASSKDKLSRQENIFDNKINLSDIWKLPVTEDWSYKERLEKERSSIGFYFSGHPLNYYNNVIKFLDVTHSSELLSASKVAINTIGVIFQATERSSRNGRFMRLLLSDTKSLYEVNIYSETYKDKRDILHVGSEIFLKLLVVKDDNGARRLLVKEIDSINNKIANIVSGYEIFINENINVQDFIKILKSRKHNDEKCLQLKVIINIPVEDKQIAVLNFNILCSSIVNIYEILSSFKGIKFIQPIINN